MCRCGRVLFLVTYLGFAATAISYGQSYGLDSRATIGPLLNNTLPAQPPGTVSGGGWTAVNAFPNLTFEDPVFLIAEPRTDRLYVCGRQGMIHFFANNANTTTRTLFLDIRARTQGYDDCGLLGFAFHPEFRIAGSPNRNYVYVHYQYSPNPVVPSGGQRPPSATPGYNRLSRFTVPDGSLIADPNSEQVLINQFDRHLWHNGGALFFGADGFLYFSNGDEGGAYDNYNQTQELNSGLFSGVFRIDVDRRGGSISHPIRRQPQDGGSRPGGWPASSSANYHVPNDNPWVNPDGSVLEEFWAVGLRSPHRMTYDAASGQIWLGDVGQSEREEVNLIEKAANYQWAYREGNINGPRGQPSPLIGNNTPPVHDYAHSDGNGCVIGGYIYRGTQHAADLYGKYLFGDNGSGRIWALTYNGPGSYNVTYLCNLPPGSNYDGLSSFGLDANNEIYMCKMGSSGAIYKLSRTGTPSPQPPALLSQTGVFTSMANLTPRSGLVPFDVNSPLWSDGAFKQRWIAVPNDGSPYGSSEQVSFSPTGEWSFPNGTVFVKHFELPVNDTNPNIRKRLETRFLVKGTSGLFYGATYKWRSDNSDADLLTASLSENITINTGSGTRTQTWFFPSPQDCLTCHTPAANFVLGVKTRQLNGDFTYPGTGRTDNQLRTWNHVGLLNPSISEANIPDYDKLAPVTDGAATLEHRVRSYLDANCAHCHRPQGVPANFDARFDTPLISQGIINGAVNNTLGIAGAKVVSPASLTKSILYRRDNTNGAVQMPPLARNVIDTNAMTVLAAWINSLPAPEPLPPPWDHDDIGAVGFVGDATYAGGTFNVQASGSDVWGYADEFHFVYQPMTGDGQITARVGSVSPTDIWAKAGVMMRQSTAANSMHAFAIVSSGAGVAFQRRAENGSYTLSTLGAAATAPHWVKLVRTGNLFSAYNSANGVNWTLIGSETIPMSATILAGLAVTAHNNGAVNSSVFDNVQLDGPPQIISQPQNLAAFVGDNATFTVTATGTQPLSYRWRFNGTNLSGATASSYTRTNVQFADAGNYSVAITNADGSATSSNAVLTVSVPTPPSITAHPQSRIVLAGSNVTFGVTVAGTPPLSFQWRLNDSVIPGATSSSFTVLNAQMDDIGSYAVTVTNNYGNAASDPAALDVDFALAANATAGGWLTITPELPVYDAGTGVTLIATPRPGNNFTGWSGDATGAANPLAITMTNSKAITANFVAVATEIIVDNPDATFTGSWSTSSTSSDYGSNYRHAGTVSGNASATATFRPTLPATGRYDVYIWYPSRSSRSAAAPFLISFAGGTTNIIVDQTAGHGQWRLIAVGVPFAGGADGFVRLSNNTGESSRRVLADAVRWVYSSGQPAPPIIVLQPQGLTIGPGEPANFSVTAVSDSPLSYQWRFNGTNLAGATSSAHTCPNAQLADAGNYAVTVSNADGDTLSLDAVLSVIASPVFVAQPQSRFVAAGSNVAFNAPAEGTLPMTYQWQFNGSNLAGATATSLSLTNVQEANEGSYRLMATNAAGAAASSNAMLVVNNPPALGLIANQTAHPHQAVSVASAATDLDLPPDTLDYSLEPGSPAGASINPTNGTFTWTPGENAANTTNVITVRVTDSGSPPLSDARTFTIMVVTVLTIESVSADAGDVTLTWSAAPGRTYRVQYKTAFDDPQWSDVPGDVIASGPTASKAISHGVESQCFYRIVLLP